MQGFEIIFQNEDCVVVFSPIISENQLSDESDFFAKFPFSVASLKRKREIITTHKLLHKVLEEPVSYLYDEIKKPILIERSEKISISHSNNYSAVIVSKNKKVGIDVEEISPRILKIKERFLHPAEKMFVENHLQNLEMLYLIWSAKEALYKLSDISLDFKEHMFIDYFTLLPSGAFVANIQHPQKQERYIMKYKFGGKYILVWVVE